VEKKRGRGRKKKSERARKKRARERIGGGERRGGSDCLTYVQLRDGDVQADEGTHAEVQLLHPLSSSPEDGWMDGWTDINLTHRHHRIYRYMDT
jgi:hypothetical protein